MSSLTLTMAVLVESLFAATIPLMPCPPISHGEDACGHCRGSLRVSFAMWVGLQSIARVQRVDW